MLTTHRSLLLLTSFALLMACGQDDSSSSSNSSTGSGDPSGATRIDILPGAYSRVFAPRFNAEGTTLAMMAQTEGGDEHIILTNRAGELQKVVLTEGVGYLTTFAWSTDGATLYYSGDDGILSIDPDAEGATPQVVVDTFAVSGFDLSRDGTKIAWGVNGQQNVSLGVLDAQGALDAQVEVERVPGSQPRFSPDGSTVLYIIAEQFATIPTSDFQESAQTLLDGEASYLSNGAWLGDNTVVLLADDAIITRELDPLMSTTLESQFAATGLDVDASGDYVFHVNGGTSLTLVDLP